MSEYCILYIDDELDQSRIIERKLVNDFVIKSVVVNSDVSYDSIISILDEKNFDYLIVDYRLNEKGNCGFDGDRIVVDFAEKFPHFPVMLLTSHDNEAITKIERFDLEKIHGKNEYIEANLKDTFVNRINRKIKEYKEQTENAEKRAEELIQKKITSNDLDAAEEAEAIKLDTFLDEVLDGKAKKIPDLIKGTNEEKIVSLLDKTDKLISKLEKYEKVSQ